VRFSTELEDVHEFPLTPLEVFAKRKRFQEIRKHKNTWAAETNDMVYYWMHAEPVVTNRRRNSATTFEPPRYLDDFYFDGGAAAAKMSEEDEEEADEKELYTTDHSPPPPLSSLPHTSANISSGRCALPSPRCSVDMIIEAGDLEDGRGVLEDTDSIFDDEGNVVAPVHESRQPPGPQWRRRPGAGAPDAGAPSEAPGARQQPHVPGAAVGAGSSSSGDSRGGNGRVLAVAAGMTPITTTTTTSWTVPASALKRIDSVEVYRRRLNLHRQEPAAGSRNPLARNCWTRRGYPAGQTR